MQLRHVTSWLMVVVLNAYVQLRERSWRLALEAQVLLDNQWSVGRQCKHQMFKINSNRFITSIMMDVDFNGSYCVLVERKATFRNKLSTNCTRWLNQWLFISWWDHTNNEQLCWDLGRIRGYCVPGDPWTISCSSLETHCMAPTQQQYGTLAICTCGGKRSVVELCYLDFLVAIAQWS